MYEAVAILKDGSNVTFSGTLKECADWSDSVQFEQLDIRRIDDEMSKMRS